jgi:hypothetical protein
LKTLSVEKLEVGGTAQRSYRVTCEGDYDIRIEFASGRSLHTQTGYVTPGMDFQHEIKVTDTGISMTAVRGS